MEQEQIRNKAADLRKRIEICQDEVNRLSGDLSKLTESCPHQFGDVSPEFPPSQSILRSMTNPVKPVSWTRKCELCGLLQRTYESKTQYVPDFDKKLNLSDIVHI